MPKMLYTAILPFFLMFLLIISSPSLGGNEWDNFIPPPDNIFDWIQLDSGEWLKGDIRVIHSNRIEFDSDKLGILKLDFDDIKRLRTAGSKRLKIETKQKDAKTLAGKLMIDESTVQLSQNDTDLELNRSIIVSITDDAKNERDHWLGTIAIGANVRGGNTETMDMITTANLKQSSAATRFVVNYLGNYSESRPGGKDGTSEETANNQRLNSYFDWLYTSRYYWRILAAEYYRDPFTNIANQYSFSSSIGYDLIRNSQTEWNINGGFGYQQTIFDQPPLGADDSSGSLFTTIGTDLDQELSDRMDFLFRYNARFLGEENGRYTHHVVTTLSIELFKAFDLDLSLIWDRIEETTPIQKMTRDAQPQITVPDQDDYQFVVGLAYDF